MSRRVDGEYQFLRASGLAGDELVEHAVRHTGAPSAILKYARYCLGQSDALDALTPEQFLFHAIRPQYSSPGIFT